MAKPADTELGLIRLPEQAREDIVALVGNSKYLPAITQQSSTENPAASIAGFCSRIAPRVGLDTATLTDVAMALWNLKIIQRDLGVDGKTLVENLTRSLEVHAPDAWK